MKMSSHLNSWDRKPSKFHHAVQASPKQHLKATHTSAITNKPTTKIPMLWGKPGKPPQGHLQLSYLAKSKLSLHHSNYRSEPYNTLPSRFISVGWTWKELNSTPQASLSLPSCASPGHGPWLPTFPRAHLRGAGAPAGSRARWVLHWGNPSRHLWSGSWRCDPCSKHWQQLQQAASALPALSQALAGGAAQSIVGSQWYVWVTSQKGFAHRTWAQMGLWWVPAGADTSWDRVSLGRTAARTTPAEPRGIQLEWPLTPKRSSGFANVPTTTLTVSTGYLTPASKTGRSKAEVRFPPSPVQPLLFLATTPGKAGTQLWDHTPCIA